MRSKSVSPESWGKCNGGITCSRNFEAAPWFVELVVAGVGDRLSGYSLPKNEDGDEVAETIDGCFAGNGVETPRAFASCASLCGARGARGGAHVGIEELRRPSPDSEVPFDMERPYCSLWTLLSL